MFELDVVVHMLDRIKNAVQLGLRARDALRIAKGAGVAGVGIVAYNGLQSLGWLGPLAELEPEVAAGILAVAINLIRKFALRQANE